MSLATASAFRATAGNNTRRTTARAQKTPAFRTSVGSRLNTAPKVKGAHANGTVTPMKFMTTDAPAVIENTLGKWWANCKAGRAKKGTVMTRYRFENVQPPTASNVTAPR